MLMQEQLQYNDMFISNAQELESQIENSKFLLATYKLDAGISSLFVILTKKIYQPLWSGFQNIRDASIQSYQSKCMTKSIAIAIFLQNKYNGMVLKCLDKLRNACSKEKDPKTIRLQPNVFPLSSKNKRRVLKTESDVRYSQNNRLVNKQNSLLSSGVNSQFKSNKKAEKLKNEKLKVDERIVEMKIKIQKIIQVYEDFLDSLGIYGEKQALESEMGKQSQYTDQMFKIQKKAVIKKRRLYTQI